MITTSDRSGGSFVDKVRGESPNFGLTWLSIFREALAFFGVLGRRTEFVFRRILTSPLSCPLPSCSSLGVKRGEDREAMGVIEGERRSSSCVSDALSGDRLLSDIPTEGKGERGIKHSLKRKKVVCLWQRWECVVKKRARVWRV